MKGSAGHRSFSRLQVKFSHGHCLVAHFAASTGRNWPGLSVLECASKMPSRLGYCGKSHPADCDGLTATMAARSDLGLIESEFLGPAFENPRGLPRAQV
jgi:hypothetical protein